MSEITRRELLRGAAATVCVCSLGRCVLAADANSKNEPKSDKPTTVPSTQPSGLVDIGPLSDYQYLGVTDDWLTTKDKLAVVVLEDRLIAIYAWCPHAGCVPPHVKLMTDHQYYCDCHDSYFDAEGRYIRGPARRSLGRYAVSVDDKGHIIVDKSKVFLQDKWTDPASFLKLP
jgi:cytochrome b6-f complex iron-sulfur subunit